MKDNETQSTGPKKTMLIECISRDIPWESASQIARKQK